MLHAPSFAANNAGSESIINSASILKPEEYAFVFGLFTPAS